LNNEYGLQGTVLNWVKSYFSDRSQTVTVKNEKSSLRQLEYGVPQGSIVGPPFFTYYTSPIERIITSHGLHGMIYADDTQIYISSHPADKDEFMLKLEACIHDIQSWCIHNKLKLNDSKTEILHISSRFVKPTNITSVSIGNSCVTSSASVKDLGVIFDNNLVLSSHVNNICRSASFAIRKISKLRKYLDRASTESLVHAFVTSRLDCCNSILYGLPSNQIAKLQRIQNTAARLVTLTNKRAHIKHVLYNLHWLPVTERIKYKILTLTYKSLHGSAPAYISNLLSVNKPTRSLRSNTAIQLTQPIDVKTKTYGERSFYYAAPKLWNTLPATIRNSPTISTFQCRLKSHLFLSYSDWPV